MAIYAESKDRNVSSKQYPLTGNVPVDEFVRGGKETGKQGRIYDTKKSKVVCALELTENGKVKEAAPE